MFSASLNTRMTADEFITQGTAHREATEPEAALACYGQAMILDPDSAAAFNNYGNTLRELGWPSRAIPFLQHAVVLAPNLITAQFNLAICHLLLGDYARGFPAYESRWNFEHMAGTLPTYPQSRWQGQDLTGKTILVMGEQGHGDIIMMTRFLLVLLERGARVRLQVTEGLVPLLGNSAGDRIITTGYQTPDHEFDYWCPIMSLPEVLGTTLDNLASPLQYIQATAGKMAQWHQRLGAKTRLRVGVCWSGRQDTWINQHKSVPFEAIQRMIQANPHHHWVNLQIDAGATESAVLTELGVGIYPGAIQDWSDTAALIANMDVVVGVDTAVSHLAAALGRPTWIMLNQYALDWRWLLNRDSSPWYPTAKLFRQQVRGDWTSVTQKIVRYLDWFKA